MQARNAVVLASDKAMLRPALWLWRVLTQLNTRSDTDILLITDEHQPLLPAKNSIMAAELDLPEMHYPTSRRISVASYWRLAAPSLLKERYKRLLYIDIDVLPMSAGLFDCLDREMGGAALAACRHLPQHVNAAAQIHGRGEFNAGVLLIDVPAFVAQSVGERTFQVIAEQPKTLKWHDQTALNMALKGQWIDLPLAYNFWPGALGTFIEQEQPPRLLHYYGPYKPWHLVSPFRSSAIRRRLVRHLMRHGDLRLLFGGFNHSRALGLRLGKNLPANNIELMARWREMLDGY